MAASHSVVLYEPTETSPEVTTAAGFLAGHSGRTREAYTLGPRQFIRWCNEHRLGLFDRTRTHIELYARLPEEGGKAPASISRRLSTPAGFYLYGTESHLRLYVDDLAVRRAEPIRRDSSNPQHRLRSRERHVDTPVRLRVDAHHVLPTWSGDERRVEEQDFVPLKALGLMNREAEDRLALLAHHRHEALHTLFCDRLLRRPSSPAWLEAISEVVPDVCGVLIEVGQSIKRRLKTRIAGMTAEGPASFGDTGGLDAEVLLGERAEEQQERVGHQSTVDLRRLACGQQRGDRDVPQGSPVVGEDDVEIVAIFSVEDDERILVEQALGEFPHLLRLVTVVSWHVDLGKAVPLDYVCDELRRGAAELVQALPRVTDQGDRETGFDRSLDHRDVQWVHVEGFVDDQMIKAACEALSEGLVEHGMPPFIDSVAHDVPDVGMGAVPGRDRPPKLIAIDERWVRSLVERPSLPGDENAFLVQR